MGDIAKGLGVAIAVGVTVNLAVRAIQRRMINKQLAELDKNVTAEAKEAVLKAIYKNQMNGAQ